MRRLSLTELFVASSVATGTVVGATLLLLHGGRGVIAVLSGFVCVVLFATYFRWQFGFEALNLRERIYKLPIEAAPKHTPISPEFVDLGDSVQAASRAMQARLTAAGDERKQLEAVLDSMQDAVVAVDSAGRIQWTNEPMQRLIPGNAFGGTVRIGHALVQTIRDPDVLECVRQALEDKTVTMRGAESLVPGHKFDVNASPMPGGGAVAVLHDITRIEEVERTQRDFVANVSHELRTPLTSIAGYVETLLDHEPGLTPMAREFLGTILKNATRMTRLTEDLLVMARVEGPSANLNPMPLRTDVLIRDAVKALRGLVQENQAILEIGDITTTQIFADQDSVMQVLGNLIENAIKYGQSRNGTRSRVVITARDITEPYDLVEFRVRDFGAGIASEHLNRIFERFYRVDKTRSRESGGTGLGLAIARHMVQTQGGTIRAESELGIGSTFVFTLPKAIYPVQNAS